MNLKLLLVALVVTSCLVGCSTDTNPITPQKMADIRKKEQSERANFNPQMTPPPAKGSK